MKKTLLTLTMAGLCVNAMAQTIVTLKPGPVIGEDAKIFTTYGCTLSGNLQPSEYLNEGNNTLIDIGDWTFSGAGCSRGTARTIIRFRELNTIPPGAIIQQAELRFFGVNSTEDPMGNSSYPGSPFTLDNVGWIKLVQGGSLYDWDESLVTFDNQPPTYGSTLYGGWVALPTSGLKNDWDQTVDVTSYVQKIVSDLGTDAFANNGFLFELQTEAYYRDMHFASSDLPDSTKWPELVVTYTYCDPNFTYCVNSEDPLSVSLNANATGSIYTYWVIDGNIESSLQNYQHDFSTGGPHEICYYIYDAINGECVNCRDICLDEDENFLKKKNDNNKKKDHITPPLKGRYVKGDDPFSLNKSNVTITPNPTNNEWNIDLYIAQKSEVTIAIYDVSGRKITAQKQMLGEGKNIVSQSANNLSSGIYYIEIKGENINFKEKVVKN